MVEFAIACGLVAVLWFGRGVIKDSADGLDETARLWRDQKSVEVALQRQELYVDLQEQMKDANVSKLATSADLYKLMGYKK